VLAASASSGPGDLGGGEASYEERITRWQAETADEK
jgi:hypothetical protein